MVVLMFDAADTFFVFRRLFSSYLWMFILKAQTTGLFLLGSDSSDFFLFFFLFRYLALLLMQTHKCSLSISKYFTLFSYYSIPVNYFLFILSFILHLLLMQLKFLYTIYFLQLESLPLLFYLPLYLIQFS